VAAEGKGRPEFDPLCLIVCLLLQMLLVAAGLEPEALVAEGDKYMASKDSKWAKRRFEAAMTLDSDHPGGHHMCPHLPPSSRGMVWSHPSGERLTCAAPRGMGSCSMPALLQLIGGSCNAACCSSPACFMDLMHSLCTSVSD
jgi:hypothetical protein